MCVYVSVLGPVIDPNAPKPEGSTITPTIGEQLIVSCTALSTANVMARYATVDKCLSFHCVRKKEHILFVPVLMARCGSVAEWLGRWTCDQQVTSSNPGLSAIKCNPGQVVNTHMCLCHQAV